MAIKWIPVRSAAELLAVIRQRRHEHADGRLEAKRSGRKHKVLVESENVVALGQSRRPAASLLSARLRNCMLTTRRAGEGQMFLVTGATGTVGWNVVQELRGSGARVRTLVRDPGRAVRLGDEVELAPGDFADPASIRRAMNGIERVFLASRNDPRQVEYETNVIDAAVAAGVLRIVKLSALGAQTGSPLAFWDAHGRIEHHLRAADVPAVVLRPNTYMSNVLGSAEAIKRTGKLFAPADDAKIAMIDPRDVAAVAALVLTGDDHDGSVYTLTGPEAITYHEVARQLSVAISRTVEFVDIPDEVAREGLVQAGVPEWVAGQLVLLFGLMRQGAAEQTTSTVRELTGRQPRNFAEFARDHATVFAG